MFFKSITKLLGVIAMVVAVGLGGSSAAYAGTPFDGGDSSCQANTNGCYLYHFKLDGDTHKIQFSVFDGACGNLTSNFTVWRKNSANIWLDGRKTSFFYINFDGGPADKMEGMQSYPCGGSNNGRAQMFLNNENKCWHLTELRATGNNCDWS